MKTKAELPSDVPHFCDFSCKYATFGKKDVSGACRREQAVYCTILKKHNNKNNKCLVAKSARV
ncbi:MAG TPA: hypothetical protein VMH23_10665 [Bacteroidota bacterium]|nr:hypothetical protein [Bacteroidota bacterium]